MVLILDTSEAVRFLMLKLSIEHHIGVCAVAGFVAYWYNKITVDRMLLIKSLAVLQIFVSVINLLTRIGTLDRVSSDFHSEVTCKHARTLWARS